MIKSILNLKGVSVLNKMEQKKLIKGGGRGCDIGPPGCPCIIPPNHPCLGGGGGNGGSDTGTCFTSSGTIQIPCDQTCPDGSQPFCN